jgi:hypothetical protein
MTPLEQAAFGWQCLLGALPAARRPAVWAPWAALFAAQALVLVACAWGAHPALSWFMAPLLRWVEGDAALRYPELFRRLPVLARDAGLVLGALAAPVVAGVSARLFEREFRGRPGPARAAWAEGASRAGALLVGALPVTLAALGLHAMLGNLGGVRLSGVARLAAPAATGAALLFVRVIFAYVPALVMLERRSGPAALAAVRSTLAPGLLAAAVPLVLLAPLAAAGTALSSASLALVDRGVPEAVMAFVLARALAESLAGLLASGAVTLAWLGAVAEPGETP